MRKVFHLGNADTQGILDAARSEAREHGWRVSIVIVDRGGFPLAAFRDDTASPLTVEIATGKARTAAISGRETRFFEEIVKNGRTSFMSVPQITFLEGGMPLIAGGECVGGIGVSGAKSEEDTQIARAGVEALPGSS